MPEGSLIFPRAEFEGRIKALQSKMVEHGQDALLLTQPADVFYTTGFLTRFWESPARPGSSLCRKPGSLSPSFRQSAAF